MSDGGLHDRLIETLAAVREQGYDVKIPTATDWLRLDDFAEKLNDPRHLTVSDPIQPLSRETLQEEAAGILSWRLAGAQHLLQEAHERMKETGETEEQAIEYLVTYAQMKLAQYFDKLREENPSTYASAMTTFQRMFAVFGEQPMYPFN